VNVRRYARSITQMLAVWFALFVGVSMATPLVNPTTVDHVCSGTLGSKLIVIDNDGDDSSTGLSMDCPLCSGHIQHQFAVDSTAAAPSSLAHALLPSQAAFIASITAPPLPSRGPPKH